MQLKLALLSLLFICNCFTSPILEYYEEQESGVKLEPDLESLSTKDMYNGIIHIKESNDNYIVMVSGSGEFEMNRADLERFKKISVHVNDTFILKNYEDFQASMYVLVIGIDGDHIKLKNGAGEILLLDKVDFANRYKKDEAGYCVIS